MEANVLIIIITVGAIGVIFPLSLLAHNITRIDVITADCDYCGMDFFGDLSVEVLRNISLDVDEKTGGLHYMMA